MTSVLSDCQDTFTQDNNYGLVKQVVSSQTRSNIRRLTRTFITLSLSDLAVRVGLNSPALVEAELVKMIQSGSIQATISHQVWILHVMPVVNPISIRTEW